VGDNVGMLLGKVVGVPVVGCSVGFVDGKRVGLMLGISVGSSVGLVDGNRVGP